MYYKATSQYGDRKLFKKLRPACEFAGVSYFATRNALIAGRPTDKVQEVQDVHTLSREEVLEECINSYWEGEDAPFALMEDDGSILFA